MAELLFKDEVYAIVGAAMDVYNDLGPGFLEGVHPEAMEMKVASRSIPFTAQHQITVKYKGRPLKKYYVADLICYDKVLVEIKAADQLTLRDEGQLLNYLKATGNKVGILINFGHYPSLEWKPMVFTKDVPNYPKRSLREDETIYQVQISED